MRLEHHLVGGYVRYISPHIIIIIITINIPYVVYIATAVGTCTTSDSELSLKFLP